MSDDLPKTDAIEKRARELERETNLSKRQSQVAASYEAGLDEDGIVDRYQGDWGVTGDVWPSHVRQAELAVSDKLADAERLVDELGGLEL